MSDKVSFIYAKSINCVIITTRVGRYFDILIYRDIFIRDYRIEGRNLSDDISKLSSY
jgi:hypothetical protein